jgi:predicted nucleotidyltransferase
MCVRDIVRAVAELSGVEAVVLGGSHASGRARPESDIDLALYYNDEHPFSLDSLRRVAKRFAASRTPTVTDFYEWGPWVNGGAWIESVVGKVDLLYRSIEHVERTIRDAHAGRIEWHFAQQAPYGFHSVIYLAETQWCIPLHDPGAVISRLKQAVAIYPAALRQRIVREFLWGAEFTLHVGKQLASAGDVYGTVGCLTRTVSQLTQVVFALNRIYFLTDKGALEMIDAFDLRPLAYGGRVRSLLTQPGHTSSELLATIRCLGLLIDDVVALAGELYVPKYVLY